jgi:RNA polymerase sigma-70 factor (family 1)
LADYSTYSDEQLVNLLKEDNHEAFKIIYDRYWDKIFNHAFTYFNSSDAAKDTVQDVFLTLWDKRASLPAITNVASYLFIMSRNKILTTLKQTIKASEYQAPEITALSADHAIIASQTEQQLTKAIEKLPSRQQQVFKLSREEGLSYAEIAEQLNIDRFTVKNHLVRALGTLRQLLTSLLF